MLSFDESQVREFTLRWRHNDHDSVSNHQPHGCLLNRLFRRRSKKTSKLRVTGLCAGNSPEAGEFPAQMASNAKKVSIWWRHHEVKDFSLFGSKHVHNEKICFLDRKSKFINSFRFHFSSMCILGLSIQNCSDFKPALWRVKPLANRLLVQQLFGLTKIKIKAPNH